MMCALPSAFLLAFAMPVAADDVFLNVSTKENVDTATMLNIGTSFSNEQNLYSISFSNKRAHGKDGRQFHMSVGNGLQSGFSGLVKTIAVSVNGIDARRLQLKKEKFRQWSGPDGEQGVKFALNFDGAWVDLSFSMRPGSPVLWCEMAKSSDERQFSPVTNVAIKVTAIPSFLECGSGRKTRFYKYARQVRTAGRLLSLPPNRTESILPADTYFIMQDGEYDGSADGKGRGPSATWPVAPTKGVITLSDSWTTSVEYRPDLSRPFRFALLEYKSKRMSNDEFRAKLVECIRARIGRGTRTSKR